MLTLCCHVRLSATIVSLLHFYLPSSLKSHALHYSFIIKSQPSLCQTETEQNGTSTSDWSRIFQHRSSLKMARRANKTIRPCCFRFWTLSCWLRPTNLVIHFLLPLYWFIISVFGEPQSRPGREEPGTLPSFIGNESCHPQQQALPHRAKQGHRRKFLWMTELCLFLIMFLLSNRLRYCYSWDLSPSRGILVTLKIQV